MARVTGKYKMEACTIGGLTFYWMDGNNYVRQKSSLTKKKVMRRKCFEGTRKSAALLAKAAPMASKLYWRLEKDQKSREVYRTIVGKVKLMLKEGLEESEIRAWFDQEYLAIYSGLETVTKTGTETVSESEREREREGKGKIQKEKKKKARPAFAWRTAAVMVFISGFFSCRQSPERSDIETRDVVVTTEEIEMEPPPPPPPRAAPEFSNVQEWFEYLAKNEKPRTLVQNLEVAMYESEGRFMAVLVGKNSYGSPDRTEIRNDFKPDHMWYHLPTSKYGGLTYEAAAAKLNKELEGFISSGNFLHSFFANSVVTNASGKEIWKPQARGTDKLNR